MSAGPRVGTEFAGYRIDAIIGRGGMSTVYRAEHGRLGNAVAIKVLAARLSDDETFRERFVRESRLAASLSHPNVIPIYDAGYESDELYIVMRYVAGSDLSRVLRQRGPLSLEAAARIVSQACRGVGAAHDRKLVHRDVKPANILLEWSGENLLEAHVYVADFGLSKEVASGDWRTATSGIAGTVNYMSPEQIEGGSVDDRTDVYSLGCVLYECLSGTPPFAREADAAVLWAHIQEDPTPVTESRPDLPPEVDQIIATAMSKSPADRYARCGDLARHLEAAAEPAADRRPQRFRTGLFRRTRKRSGYVWVAMGAAVLMAAILGGIVTALATRTDRVSSPPQPRLTPVQALLRGAGVNLHKCLPPTTRHILLAQTVECDRIAPSVSTLTVTRFNQPNPFALYSRYSQDFKRFSGVDSPPLRLNSGKCGSTRQAWGKEDAWRLNGSQVRVVLDPRQTVRRAVGRVFCWISKVKAPEIEWTLNVPGAYLVVKADGSPQATRMRLYEWWKTISRQLVPRSAPSG